MPSCITSLSNASRRDLGLLGGKAATLNKLINQNILVPPGQIVTTVAYEAFVRENGIDGEIERLVKNISLEMSLQEINKTIESLFLPHPFPPKIDEQITQMTRPINYPVAVRSSAQAEDAADASWAGQYATYLALRPNEIGEKIKQCWASLFNPTALQYAREHGVDVMKNRMAVIVQRMINADVSGVCFTRDPVSSDENTVRIEAVYGLGEGIVQGLYTPDQYIFTKNTKDLQKEIHTQDMMMAYHDDETGEIAVSEENQKKQKLPDTLIRELADTALRIEEILGYPSDIEWAVEDGKIWILQARAITV